MHLIIKPANKPEMICRKIRPKATKRLLQWTASSQILGSHLARRPTCAHQDTLGKDRVKARPVARSASARPRPLRPGGRAPRPLLCSLQNKSREIRLLRSLPNKSCEIRPASAHEQIQIQAGAPPPLPTSPLAAYPISPWLDYLIRTQASSSITGQIGEATCVPS